MPITGEDGPTMGSGSTEFSGQIKTSMKTTTQKGGGLKLNWGGAGGLSANMRLNDSVTKIGPMFGFYSPELAMILGGQELL